MTKFYNSIAPYYRYIFPLNLTQLAFCQSIQPNFNSNVLDIGCAVGDFSLALAGKYQNVTAIDLDEEMICLAKEQAATVENICFYKMDMLKIATIFPHNSFDLVTCFGNTVVHLSYTDAVAKFFSSVKTILAENGKFAFQIINYDRIFTKNLKGLSTIDNEKIKFERYYNYTPISEKVEFSTVLTIKETNKKIENTISLLALRQNTICKLLKQAGFENIRFYGSFKGDEFTDESVPIVVEAW